jgi:hypothetical protein
MTSDLFKDIGLPSNDLTVPILKFFLVIYDIQTNRHRQAKRQGFY